jgi:hypothetical protein
MGKGREGDHYSMLRQPRLAHPVNNLLDILRVLEDKKTFDSFDCEAGVDPQHLRGFGSRLRKLSQLRMGGRQRDMLQLLTGLARHGLVQPMHRLPIAWNRR